MAGEKYSLHKMISDLIEEARLHRSCLTCVHFEEATEKCHRYEQRPPARVIAMGCPEWEQEPPF